MKLEFIKEFRLLRILDCSELELKQLNIECTIEWVSWQGRKKKMCSKNYLHDSTYIPGGFWMKILKLREKGYNVEITNIKEFIRQSLTLEDFTEWALSLNTSYTTNGFAPYDYQIKGAWLALKYPISRGEFATGAGKTYIMYLIIRYLQEFVLQPEDKILVVVPSIMLVNQTSTDFKKYHLDNELEVDKIYGGSQRTKSAQIIVGNIDSVMNYDSDFFMPIRSILYDEAHKTKTDGYQQIYAMMIPQPLKFIYSCSGTFYDEKTPEDFKAASVAGPILIRVGYDQLQKMGSIAPVKIKMIKFKYDYNTSYEYYHHPDSINVNKRNHFELKFIHSQIPRFKNIVKIASSIQHNQLMLFKGRKYLKVMSEYMRKVYPDRHILIIHGDISSQTREDIKQFTEENEGVIIMATYQTMSTGVSINKLSTIHLVDGAKSFILVRQSIGRGLRLHSTKKYCTVIDYHDHFTKSDTTWPGRKGKNISVSHAAARKKIYKTQKMPFESFTINI